MSQTPSLNPESAGCESRQTDPSPSCPVDQQALPVSCLELISRLEDAVARSGRMDHDDFIDDSADIARKMLKLMNEFSHNFFPGTTDNQAREEIARTQMHADAYELVLKTRPLSNAVLRAFWNVEESRDIQAAHAELGEALARACAATCCQAVLAIGRETQFGQEIDQGTVALIKQLQSVWV